jgi:hypothetical protein
MKPHASQILLLGRHPNRLNKDRLSLVAPSDRGRPVLLQAQKGPRMDQADGFVGDLYFFWNFGIIYA